jgi:hypothetical protein
VIRAKVTLRRRGDLRGHIMKMEKALQGPTKVKVGLPAGKADVDVVSIAIWNHFGTSRGIPPRPFITVAMFKGRGEIRMNLRKIAYNVTVNGKPLTPELQKLGVYGAGKIQDQIASNMPPPNAPSTIAQKGSSGTLIDTGRMRQSITWELDGASGVRIGFKGSK